MSLSKRGMLKRAGIVACVALTVAALASWARVGGPDRIIGIIPDITVPVKPAPPKPIPPKQPGVIIPDINVPPPKPVTPSTWFVITSDPQYPWTPYDDGTAASPSGDEHALSRQLIEQQYDSINRFAAGRNVAATFINGDLTAYGHDWQVSYMQGAIARLKQPVYMGLGNHDYENNVNDCAENSCARRSVYWFVDHMSKLPLDKFDSAIWRYYQFPTNREEVRGSFGWRKDFGPIAVIQLNNHPAYATWAEGFSGARGMTEIINVRPAWRWLERELANARAQGKAIVLMLHEFSSGGRDFDRMADQYGVDVVFAGHYHQSIGPHEHFTIGERAPIIFSGSASQRTYLVAEHRKDTQQLIVYKVLENKPEARVEVRRIPLTLRFGNPLPKPYPFHVRVQNQGGYRLAYRVGNRQVTHDLRVGAGQGQEMEVPAGAYDVRLSGAAETWWAWKPWNHFYNNPHLEIDRDHCVVNWGSTFNAGAGPC